MFKLNIVVDDDFAVSYDLHGVSEEANDHARVIKVLSNLARLKEVSGSEQQGVSTTWRVSSTLGRKQLFRKIIQILKKAKSKQMLTARSITLLVVRVEGKFLVDKSKL